MNKQVVCIGGALADVLYYARDEILPATTNYTSVEQTPGGVARNLAQQLAILNVPVSLIAAFGDDPDGRWLTSECEQAGIDVSMCVSGENCRTGRYTGIINPDGSLFTAMLSNDCNRLVDPAHLDKYADELKQAAFIVADTNLTIAALQWLTDFVRETDVPLIIEPVSVPPAKKLQSVDLDGVYMITPNEDELPALSLACHGEKEEAAKALLAAGVQHVWLHEGAHGSSLFSKGGMIHIKANQVKMVDSTGAGDGSLAGCIWGLYHNKNLAESIRIGHWLAAEILQVKGAIARHITQDHLRNLQLRIDE